jgi:hypothetical protein
MLPMSLHGHWDSSFLLNVATGGKPSAAQYAVYPLAIACAIAVVPKNWYTGLPS